MSSVGFSLIFSPSEYNKKNLFSILENFQTSCFVLLPPWYHVSCLLVLHVILSKGQCQCCVSKVGWGACGECLSLEVFKQVLNDIYLWYYRVGGYTGLRSFQRWDSRSDHRNPCFPRPCQHLGNMSAYSETLCCINSSKTISKCQYSHPKSLLGVLRSL